MLAACKASQGQVTPKERVRELSSEWRRAEKKVEVKKNEARLRSLRKQRKKRKETSSPSRDLETELVVLAKEEYDSYKAIIAQNQVKLKQWADIATCNYTHQYLLVEVRGTFLSRIYFFPNI
jgi:hypothetical protein